MVVKHYRKNEKRWPYGRGEQGGLTIFTAVLVLILMTVLLVYATRVSLFETRISANEVRQKQAYNVAEAAIGQAEKYLMTNSAKLLSSRADAFPDINGDLTGDGWFSAGNLRWGTCTSTEIGTQGHPCAGDIPATAGSFFYDDPATNTGVDSIVVNEVGFPTGATARLIPLLCFIDPDNPGTSGCGAAPATAEEEPGVALLLTLLAYGYSDCTDITGHYILYRRGNGSETGFGVQADAGFTYRAIGDKVNIPADGHS